MILILSTETDVATERVIKWLKYYGADYLRLNNENILHLENIEFRLGFPVIKFRYNNGDLYDLSKTNVYWYRRGDFSFCFQEIEQLKKKGLPEAVHLTLKNEYEKLWDFVHLSLKRKSSIGSFTDNNLCKLDILLTANDVGLRIPETIITNRKSELLSFASSL